MTQANLAKTTLIILTLCWTSCEEKKPQNNSPKTYNIEQQSRNNQRTAIDVGISNIEVKKDNMNSLRYEWDLQELEGELSVTGYQVSFVVIKGKGDTILNIQKEIVDTNFYTIDLNCTKADMPYIIQSEIKVISTEQINPLNPVGGTNEVLYTDGKVTVPLFRHATSSTPIDSICTWESTDSCSYITFYDGAVQSGDSTLILGGNMAYSAYNLDSVKVCLCDSTIISDMAALIDCWSNLTPVIASTTYQQQVTNDPSMICN